MCCSACVWKRVKHQSKILCSRQCINGMFHPLSTAKTEKSEIWKKFMCVFACVYYVCSVCVNVLECAVSLSLHCALVCASYDTNLIQPRYTSVLVNVLHAQNVFASVCMWNSKYWFLYTESTVALWLAIIYVQCVLGLCRSAKLKAVLYNYIIMLLIVS